jgi:hypothetical protein
MIIVVGLIGILTMLGTAYGLDDWQMQKVQDYNGKTFKVLYQVFNGELEGIRSDLQSQSVILTVKSNNTGNLTVTLPRDMIDARISEGNDDQFFVLINGQESNFKEPSKSACFRTLSIPFASGSNEIEIIGGPIMPHPLSPTHVPPVFFTTDKSEYEKNDVITVTGCTDLVLDGKQLTFDVLNSEGRSVKTISVIPSTIGTFSTSFAVGKENVNGNYTILATYAGQNTTKNVVVIPEFPFVLLTFGIASILVIFLSTLRNLPR